MVQPVTLEGTASDPRGEGSARASAPAELLGLLRQAYVARRSGHLHISHGRERRGLLIRGAYIVQGRSDVAGEHLGDVLVRHGLLSRVDLDRAVAEVLAQRRPLGAVLAGLSLIDEARLEEAVGWHVREILFAALDRPGGTAWFEDLESGSAGLPEGELASGLPTGHVLLEAARRLKDPATVREALGDLERRLVLAEDPRFREHPIALTPTDGFVLSRIDGAFSARQIVDLMPLSAEETERSLLVLLCTGAIACAPERRAAQRAPAPPRDPAPPPRAATPAAPARPLAASAPPAPSPSPAGASASPAAAAAPDAVPNATPSIPALGPQEVRRLIQEAYQSLALRDHFELLGVTPQVSAAELRAAYALLARALHPDACGDPALADLNDQREVVFFRVCQAYETLRDPQARTAYERDFRRRKSGPPAPPLLVRADSVASPGPAAPPSSAPETPSPPRAPVLPARPDPPAQSLEERLAETIDAGEKLLQEGNYWAAAQRLEPTLPQARGELLVRARLALARVCLKNPSWLKRAESHLQVVVREDPAQVAAHLLLGGLYRTQNFRARAIAAYHKVLAFQPENQEALRELATLEAAEPRPPAKGPLLGFLKRR
jgi:tetratricopeptide (TPR) repeat protein